VPAAAKRRLTPGRQVRSVGNDVVERLRERSAVPPAEYILPVGGDWTGTMAKLAGRRMAAEIDGDFVVFLIGARPNSKLRMLQALRDLGGRRGMKHMLDYLVAHPEKGLLAYEMGFPTIVQYWRSFEHLEAFANNSDDPHLDAWRNYWRRVGRSGRTGIWHETYLVRAGEYEAIYGNMPAHGLGKAGRLVPIAEASRARERIRAATPS
jgi:hypothetical protein